MFSGNFTQRLQHLLMSAMDSIKVTDSDYAVECVFGYV
jgi:hypothetical protein